MLPDDTTTYFERPASVEPWLAVLSTLDPTTMDWRDRDVYLDPAHVPYLFNTAGNRGTTIWVNARVVGCWGASAVLAARTECAHRTTACVSSAAAPIGISTVLLAGSSGRIVV